MFYFLLFFLSLLISHMLDSFITVFDPWITSIHQDIEEDLPAEDSTFKSKQIPNKLLEN